MPFEHKTKSTVDTDPENPDHVGARAWNEEHVPSPGSIFPVVWISAEGDPPNSVLMTVRGAAAVEGSIVATPHSVSLSVDVSKLSAPDGCKLVYFVSHHGFSENVIPKITEEVKLSVYCGTEPNFAGALLISLILYGAEGYYPLPAGAVMSATIMAEVVAMPVLPPA